MWGSCKVLLTFALHSYFRVLLYSMGQVNIIDNNTGNTAQWKIPNTTLNTFSHFSFRVLWFQSHPLSATKSSLCVGVDRFCNFLQFSTFILLFFPLLALQYLADLSRFQICHSLFSIFRQNFANLTHFYLLDKNILSRFATGLVITSGSQKWNKLVISVDTKYYTGKCTFIYAVLFIL